MTKYQRINFKKVLSIVMVFILATSMSGLVSGGECYADYETGVDYENKKSISESRKVSEELIEKIGLYESKTYTSSLDDDTTTYSCIIWTEDIDKEAPIIAGIDAAEQTRETARTVSAYEYPYTITSDNGITYIDLNFSEKEDDKYIQTYVETQRSVSKEMYIEQNEAFVTNVSNLDEKNITYISEYSPCIFANLTAKQIVELSQLEKVDYIGYWNTDLVYTANDADPLSATDISYISTIMSSLNIDDVKNTYGMSGTGVKIGQFEMGYPSNSGVTKNVSNSENYANHPTNVCTIMKTVAPNATYYAYDCSTSAYTSQLVSGMEWFIQNGVNIVNISMCYEIETSLNSYEEICRWVDYVSYNHNINVIIASGNNSAWGVYPPAMSNNAITVGNTDNTSPYTIHPTSSYSDAGVLKQYNMTYKPDLVAIGTYPSGEYGTSYSTPVVTGLVALLCQYNYALKTETSLTKAILSASTGATSRSYSTGSSNYIMYGAGLVDGLAALNILRSLQARGSTVTNSSTTVEVYKITLTGRETSKTVALAYPAVVTSTSGTIPAGMSGQIVLEVYSPDDTRIAVCNIDGVNLKVVKFVPQYYGSGTYKIKISKSTSSGPASLRYGLAWY